MDREQRGDYPPSESLDFLKPTPPTVKMIIYAYEFSFQEKLIVEENFVYIPHRLVLKTVK